MQMTVLLEYVYFIKVVYVLLEYLITNSYISSTYPDKFTYLSTFVLLCCTEYAHETL